ncbi:MAG TPA: potassium transporter Kup, partial [Syntrophobacteraceae bacterium]|nr:potassium transporter Kup [Syntrophobacteraceae bacterium]
MTSSNVSGDHHPSPSIPEDRDSHTIHGSSASKHDSRRTLILALGAMGVVYGDIGTSPLYTVKECFHGLHAIALTPANILGVMSLIFWSMTVVVT